MKNLSLISTLVFSVMAYSVNAAEQPAAHTMALMQQDYSSAMNTMHAGMEKSMSTQNADVAFAQGMLAHHKGAVDMAKIELKYGKDPEMRELAKNIITAQKKEITQMNTWLAEHPDKNNPVRLDD